MLRPLSTERFRVPTSELSAGPAPVLQWIETDLLVVDASYQRDISRRGAANVHQIAEHFDWSKFAPVIVAGIEGGQFAVVDGQHRTTAAMLRGIKKVPCQLVIADRAQQAAAYAAVNGNVTKTTLQQLHYAKLAAKDSEAAAVAEVCAAAGVEILRRNVVCAKMKPGQTQAVGALRHCLAKYGRETLVRALNCLTKTADGNAGFVRASIVEALCDVLHRRQDWRDSGDALLRAIDKFSFPDAWGEVTGDRDKMFPNTGFTLFAELVRKHLSKNLAHLAKKPREPVTGASPAASHASA
jgi:hypothetical protein